jgi:hypothetical protein
VDSIRSHVAPVRGLDPIPEDAVWRKIHLRDTDTLVLSGSLVDGSGTPSSDLDFCVIAEEADDRFDRQTFPRHEHMRYYTSGSRVKGSFDYLPDSLLGVDVEYRTIAEVLAMLDAHDSLYAHLRSRARKSSSFASTPIDFRLISRLTYGVVLQDRGFEAVRKRVNAQEIAFTAFRTAVGSYPDFRDLVGMLAQGDHESAGTAVAKLATDTFRGLTHLHGNTNRNPKYLVRFLDRLPASLQDLASRYRGLGNPVGAGESDALENVFASLDLIDEVYEEIRGSRDSTPAFNSREKFLALLTAELHQDMQWNAEISNEYCFRAREAVDGLPSLRELATAMMDRKAASHSLSLQQWAADRPAPCGEDNKAV